MDHKRLGWVDGLRGLAVFLVVLGHLYKGFPLIFPFCTLIAMPMFYFLAGYVFHEGKPLGAFLKGLFFRLYVPYLIFSLLPLKSMLLLLNGDLSGLVEYWKDFFSGLDKNSGIAHYLAGQTPLGEAICRTNVPNGYLLPATTSIANPMVLLEDELFEKMMADCSDVFEYIIVDTPPLASVADALKISTHCDGSLLVIRSDSVPRKMVINSARLLKKTGRPLLGTVLNRVDMGKRNNPYYRYYRYGEKFETL